MTDHTRLNKFVNHIGESLLTTQLETNLKTFLDWGLLGIGGFANINDPVSGCYGGNFSEMRVVDDPSYDIGQVWETARKDWVWETGVDYAYQPINISGVSINGTLYTTGDVTYSHHYNYPLGRVVFDEPIATGSEVKINHSYRNVQVYLANQAPWFDQIQFGSHRVDDSTFHDTYSGSWNVLANNRVQLPAIVIEAVPRRIFKPYNMGSISNFVYQDVDFYILAEDRWWRNQLIDIVSLEKDHTVILYDNNTLVQNTGFPLDERGMTVSNPQMYPTLVDQYEWKKARFYNVVVTDMTDVHDRLYRGHVKVTFEIVMA